MYLEANGIGAQALLLPALPVGFGFDLGPDFVEIGESVVSFVKELGVNFFVVRVAYQLENEGSPGDDASSAWQAASKKNQKEAIDFDRKMKPILQGPSN